ncbi:hypothetical protein DD238_003412 [Peronospora effusa]|uniref:Uncharacterized protein n=1 Tax=Peronospora effusa TaxID=542832 RepID=A0A3M6VJN4_9STRA|nr:hypothetical protein DD238_003412 [Peronospora effusa]RQM16406.1 hypothetical protein DD237_003418 [Peronospora effusa]
MTITGDVADTGCDGTKTPISSEESGLLKNDHDIDAIRAEYQQCVAEYEEAEMHIIKRSYVVK